VKLTAPELSSESDQFFSALYSAAYSMDVISTLPSPIRRRG